MNELANGKAYHSQTRDVTVDWTDGRLKRITRMKMLTDNFYPWFDVSYVHGELHDGRLCRVQVPFKKLTKARYMTEVYKRATRDGVYLKSLCNLREVIAW